VYTPASNFRDLDGKRSKMNACGKLVGIYSGAEKGAGKASLESASLVAGIGLDGDTHAGRDPNRQISLFADETLQALNQEGFSITAGELSANLITAGLPLNDLQAGDKLRIGDAEIELSEPRKPCASLTKLDYRLPKRLYRKCGWLGRVVKSGSVRPGATIEVLSS
jgi:MOSC domain-containing protein YiiM